MKFFFQNIYRGFKFIYFKISAVYSYVITWSKFNLNGVEFVPDFTSLGIPIVAIARKGTFKIGRNFIFNSGVFYNMIGRQQKCYFVVYDGATLTIGSNVSMSSTAITCYQQITIQDNVKIGGNVVIYDTDFHSLDPLERNHVPEIYNTQTKPVLIMQGAFIGAHSTILKGVTIGENSIVGAGSVVSKNIPSNEIWAGNPAKFIRSL